jgi:hypothetical protein
MNRPLIVEEDEEENEDENEDEKEEKKNLKPLEVTVCVCV